MEVEEERGCGGENADVCESEGVRGDLRVIAGNFINYLIVFDGYQVLTSGGSGVDSKRTLYEPAPKGPAPRASPIICRPRAVRKSIRVMQEKSGPTLSKTEPVGHPSVK
jgi:hypothetical protein